MDAMNDPSCYLQDYVQLVLNSFPGIQGFPWWLIAAQIIEVLGDFLAEVLDVDSCNDNQEIGKFTE